MKMEVEEPRSTGEALECTRNPPHIHLDTTGFNPNMDSEAMGCDEAGIPLSRITPTQVKEEPQKGFMAKHWESQWQTFLKTVESPQSQCLSPPLSIETTPWDDARAFLISFEQVAKACRWPKEEWAARLLPAFSGDAEQTFLDLEIRNREDYGSVKEAILRRDAMTQEKHRQNFRGFCYPEAKGLKDGYRQLHGLCHQWLKVEKHSKEEILELLVLEQFLTILPLEMQKWVMEHYPESCPQAVALAEGFLQKQQEAEKEEEQVPQAVVAAVISSEANWTVMGEQKQLSTRIKEETNDEQTHLFAKKEWETPDDGEKFVPENTTVVKSYSPSMWKVEENFSASFKKENMSPVVGKEEDVDGLKMESEGKPCGLLSEKAEYEAPKGNLWDLDASRKQEGEHTKERRDALIPHLTRDSLENPVQKEHKINTGERLHTCPVCGKGFNHSKSLTSHQRIHTGEKPYICSDCGKGFYDQSSLTKHKRIHTEEKPYQCSVCEKSFRQKVHLITHQRIHTGETPYKCLECGKTFIHATSLVSHQRIHTGEKPYQCSVCGKSFTYKASLRSHQSIHTREKLYKCSDCNKCYLIQSSLIKHKRIHRGEKPYKCLECGKTFIHNTSLTSHQRIHTGEKPYKCSVCGKSFTYRASLCAHQQIHTGERPYKCANCSKNFSDKSSLSKHEIIHTKGRPHKCLECGKSFSVLKSLVSHQRIHTGEKPHKCSECGKGYNYKTSLYAHQRIHTGNRPYECSECSKTFVDKSSLTKHEKTHTRGRPHQCLKCGKNFDLTSHQRIQIEGEIPL